MHSYHMAHRCIYTWWFIGSLNREAIAFGNNAFVNQPRVLNELNYFAKHLGVCLSGVVFIPS